MFLIICQISAPIGSKFGTGIHLGLVFTFIEGELDAEIFKTSFFLVETL